MQPLRFATAGSVDDGKSTLIGRLLYDSRAIQEDQLAAVERASVRRGAAQIDLSLLTDGLEAEREQGITIDVAYRYFATPRRKFIIADLPGHEQYTRNMATGASNADALVLLVDAKKGLLPQTRRHLLIARLLGLRQVVVFVNKMDAVGYERAAFARVREALIAFAAPLDLQRLEVIPGSALNGDMVVQRGDALPWYEGPTLLETLEGLNAAAEAAAAGPLRFPIQLVSRPQGDAARGYMGRIESGHLLAGTEVLALPSRRRTRVRQILVHDKERELALAGDSVTVVLADDIDLARGDCLADPTAPPRETRSLELTLIWLGAEPLRPGGRYLLQQASRRTPAKIAAVTSRLDIHTLHQGAADGEVVMNDVVRARLTLQASLFVDPYESVRATGAMILIDEATNQTVAAGLVP
ncbi:MAG TPA: GTP-binding protein [Burkholderiales bacterium]|nr:GTP-binding protein [Burkholderiales bacterium]